MSKSYRQYCGLARSLDVVGERWTLLVVRNLLLGPKRYGDLLAQLPGITTNLLAKRLREMTAAGLVVRTHLAAPSNVAVYELTDEGRALEPAIMELARWGGRFMNGPRNDDTVDIGWGLLSLKRRYLGGRAPLAVELRVGDRRFALDLDAEVLRVEEREATRAELVLAGTSEAFSTFFFRGPPTRERLVSCGIALVQGGEARVATFVARFAPPPPMADARPGSGRARR